MDNWPQGLSHFLKCLAPEALAWRTAPCLVFLEIPNPDLQTVNRQPFMEHLGPHVPQLACSMLWGFQQLTAHRGHLSTPKSEGTPLYKSHKEPHLGEGHCPGTLAPGQVHTQVLQAHSRAALGSLGTQHCFG